MSIKIFLEINGKKYDIDERYLSPEIIVFSVFRWERIA
jgi:hypothetical protein